MRDKQFLRHLHERLAPPPYLEVGVRTGRSLALARPPARSVRRPPVALAFIDGMHHVEYALRDFINVERNADWKRRSLASSSATRRHRRTVR